MVRLTSLTLAALVLCAAAADEGALDDKTFVEKASAAGLAEVNAGRLAEKQASSADVKKFAKMMVEDHTKANKELNKLADGKRFKVATRMTKEHQVMADKLAKLDGAQFDREYMAGQVKDHEEAVALFEKQAKSGTDADLKNWAEKTLPTLKKHLKMAKEIKDKLKGG
jgi:putative membrane protein